MLLTRNFIKFLVIGSFNTLICLVVFKGLLLCRLNYLVASGLMNIWGIILGYTLNAKLLYKTKLSLKQLLKYFNVYALAFTLNLAMMYSLVSLLKLPDLVAQVVTIALLTIINYQLVKLLVFRKCPA